jgi:hypothetical protein
MPPGAFWRGVRAGRGTDDIENLNVQPTIRIRPGYKFNVLVGQDIIFPERYSAG